MAIMHYELSLFLRKDNDVCCNKQRKNTYSLIITGAGISGHGVPEQGSSEYQSGR